MRNQHHASAPNAAAAQQNSNFARLMAQSSFQRAQTEANALKPNMKGKRSFIISGYEVVVDERYEVTHMIGAGAYGSVYSAKDHKTKEDVAIKKI